MTTGPLDVPAPVINRVRWVGVGLVVLTGVLNSAWLIPGTTWPLFAAGLIVAVLIAAVIAFRQRDRLATRDITPATRLPGRGLQAATRFSGRGLQAATRLQLARISLLAFVALCGYGLLTTLWTDPWVTGPGRPGPRIDIAPSIVRIPLIEAGLVAVLAWLVVRLTPTAARRELIWWVAATLVPVVLVSWGREALADGEISRVRGALGGGAIIYVATMLGAAIMIQAALEGRRRRLSVALAAILVALTLLSGARAVFIVIPIWLLLLAPVAWRSSRHLPRPRLLGWVAAGLAAAIALIAVSPLSRRLNLDSEKRWETWQLGWHAVTQSPWTVIFGMGSGVVWPWFEWESGRLEVPWRSIVRTHFGYGLYHAHSLYVTVFVELGLVGLTLLGISFAPLVIRRLRVTTVADGVVISALLATLVGFGLDSYLLKNFALAFVWWLIVFATLLPGPDPDLVDTSGPPPPR